MRTVEVAAHRLTAWLDGFAGRHGDPTCTPRDGALVLTCPDGTCARVRVPFPPFTPDPGADYLGLVEHVTRRRTFGLLLLRRGGYAVGVVQAGQLLAFKVGTRYVQSRTAAGGWSQQRFARRRANQTAEIVAAAAALTERLVAERVNELEAVVTGGDRLLLKSLLGQPRLASLRPLVAERVLAIGDPRQRVLEQSVDRAGACLIEVSDVGGPVRQPR